MSTLLKVISLTGVCSSLVVATPCLVGVDVVSGSKSKSVLVSDKDMLRLSVILPFENQRLPSCFEGQCVFVI